jgi:hypothetical protein
MVIKGCPILALSPTNLWSKIAMSIDDYGWKAATKKAEP